MGGKRLQPSVAELIDERPSIAWPVQPGAASGLQDNEYFPAPEPDLKSLVEQDVGQPTTEKELQQSTSEPTRRACRR